MYIDKPGLFGGDDTGGEGGIQGQLRYHDGRTGSGTTGIAPEVADGVSAGVSWTGDYVFSGLVSCYSASPNRGYTAFVAPQKAGTVMSGTEKATILLENTEGQLDDESDLLPEQIANLRAIHAMNPAHILVECATNRDWGRQLTLDDDLNLDSYRAAADTLYEEGFGLCFRYNRQDGLDTFVQQILDHVGAVQ